LNNLIKVLIACDADSDRADFGGTRFDDPGPMVWNGVKHGVPHLLDMMEGVTDDFEKSLPIIWCLRADQQVEGCHGEIDWAVRSMANIWERVKEKGHLIGWHPHHWRWSDGYKCWHQDIEDIEWQKANLEKGALAFSKPPLFSRTGWYAMNNTTMNILEGLGVKMDMSAAPGMERPGTADSRGTVFAGEYNWSRCRNIPYRPHPLDYQTHDPRERGIIELPCTTFESSFINLSYKIRYRLRGTKMPAGGTKQVNITAHPWIFSTVIRHVIKEAKARGHAFLVSFFHPDELLGAGIRIGGQSIYKSDHIQINLERLKSEAAKANCLIEFPDPKQLIVDLNKKIIKGKNRINVEPVQPGQISMISGLMKNVFPSEKGMTDIEQWISWKYNRLSPIAPTIVGTKSGNRLLGQYVTLSLKTWWFGQKITSAYSCDTAVAPYMQGKGVSGALTRVHYNMLRKMGVPFVWGIPNSRFFPIWTRSLAWKEIAPFPVLLRPMDIKAIFSIWYGNSKLIEFFGLVANLLWRIIAPVHRPNDKIILKSVKHFGIEADGIWKDVQSRVNISVVRDADYLNRRYGDAPGKPYNLLLVEKQGKTVGLVVTRLMEKRGLRLEAVCEILMQNEHLGNIGQVIDMIIWNGKQKGAQVIGACCLPHHPEYRRFLLKRFLPVPKRFHPEPTYFAAYPLDPNMDEKKLFDGKNWYLSWGDLDTI